MDQLKLPIDVVEGHLGELVLQIPWSNLKNKPVKVLINNVFLVAVPKLEKGYDAAEEERRELLLKLNKLEDLEVADRIHETENLSPEEIRKNQSFTDSLVTKIIDNLQITINNIHIRYEDNYSVPGHEFSIGISLEELSAVSTNEGWQPSFLADNQVVTHKLATLGSLSLYWNTDSQSTRDMPHDELIEFMKKAAESDPAVTNCFQYILRPVSGVGHITLNKDATAGPKTKAQLLFDELAFVFDSDQYRDMLWTVELFNVYQLSRDFQKLRPKIPIKEDPKAWFRYVAKCVLSEVHQKRKEWTWDYILERRNDRIRYVELFKKKTVGSPILLPEELEEFNNLEKKTSFEDLRFYRTIAKSQLRKEKALLKPQQTAPKDNSWSSWIWGAKPADNTATESEASENADVVMTEEQRMELYEAIEWDEKQAIIDAIDIPKDAVTMEIEAALKSGSFRLRRNPHGDVQDVVTVLFNGFNSAFHNRPDSYTADISLHELRVDDGSQDTLYKQVVTVKSIGTDILPDLTETNSETCSDSEELIAPSSVDKDAFFWLSFENNPLDGNADSNLFIKMKSITIFYNTKFLENIARFFRPPKAHLETIGAIINAAGATVEEIRDQTRIGLEYALQQHKTVNLKLDMQAPLIVIPLDANSWSSPCAIIDAGHISAVSHLVGKGVIEEVNKKKSMVYTNSDWKRLESLMYDKFNVQLHNTQFLIGSNVRDTMRELHNGVSDTPCSVLDRINMDFLVEISILPEAHSLTKFKVSGNLPKFVASMSDAKYKIMMQIVDVVIPNFNFEDEDEEVEEPTLRINNGESSEPTQKSLSRAQTLADSSAHEFAPKSLSRSSTFAAGSNKGHDAYVAPLGRARGFSIVPLAPILPDIDSEEESTPLPAPVGPKNSDQKIFEFNFRVDKVEMFLYRCTDPLTLQQEPLVDMVLESFDLYYYFKDGEMLADVVLKSLCIEDYVQKNVDPELRKFATSIENSESSESDELFKVKYKRVNTGKIDSIGNVINDQLIDVTLSTIKFVINPKSFLSILDFIITTFTSPEVPPPSESNQLALPSTDTSTTSDSVAKIDITVDLHGIILLLNDDGIKLATTKLDSAFVKVFMIPESMKVEARIGKLTLHDEVNSGIERDSMLRKLISIEGNDLADFKYETFPPGTATNNIYNSSIFFHAGSIKFHVVEEPFSRIMQFGSKFVQMKALFDSARQVAYNQANQIEDANKIHFDIHINTPILVFPKIIISHGETKCDTLVAHLGEIYANNEYIHFPEDPTGPLANHISFGIRSTRLFSKFHFPDSVQALEIIDNFGMSFDLSYVEPYKGITRPVTIITGTLTETTVRITELQYQFLMEMSSNVAGIFAGDGGLQDEEMNDLEEELKQQKHIESVGISRPISPSTDFTVSKVDFSFEIEKLALSLYTNTASVASEDLETTSLSKFTVDDLGVKLRMKASGDLESDVHIKAFTVHDTRSVKDNKFSEIIPSATHGEYQFMCNVTMVGPPEDRLLKAVLTVDSPRMILAMDYLFALKAFLMYGFPPPDSLAESTEDLLLEDDEEEGDVPPPQQPQSAMKIHYHVNIVDASVILIANPKLIDSEAIVLKTEHFVLSQEQTMVMSVSKVGVFLCKMNAFDRNRLRILDDFSLVVSIDDRDASPTAEISKIDISVEPLVLRLALRDILLVLDIVKRANILSSEVDAQQDITEQQKETPKYSRFSKRKRLRRSSVSLRRSEMQQSIFSGATSITRSRAGFTEENEIIVRGQRLNAEFDGLRLVLIGAFNELPILDMCAKAFTVNVRDWSSNLTVETSIETFVNIYNSEKSAWEPLVEPWDLGLHVARSLENNNTTVNVFSRKLMELTITSQTIATISRAVEFISDDVGDDFLLRPRDDVAPYRILNQTGYSIEIWVDGNDKDGNKDSDMRREVIPDNEEIPWRFYDWNTVRENLSTDAQKVNLGVRLLNSPYEPIRNISVTRVGEHLHVLSPRIRRVNHQLLCEVIMDGSIKRIVLRSALTFVNQTQAPMVISVGRSGNMPPLETSNAEGVTPTQGHVRLTAPLTWELNPGDSRAIPIEYMYENPIDIKPFDHLPFRWSDQPLYWKDMLAGPRSVVCPPQDSSTGTYFYVQASAVYDKSLPPPKTYPHMKVVLSAPLEIVNLLPFDLVYRVYDKTVKKEWTNSVNQGKTSSMHVVQLSHFLMLNVHPQQGEYDSTDFAVINTNKAGDFKRENTLVTRSRDGQRLTLRLHFVEEEGKGLKVMIYSPYIVLNKTGLDVKILEKFNTATSQVFNVTSTRNGHEVVQKKAVPKMWSFDRDSNKRAIIKVGDSKWSEEISFDTIGKDSDIVISSTTRQSEIHVGAHIAEGQGMYKLTKIVTLTPRFIVHNKLKDDIQIRDTGSSEAIVVKSNGVQPIHFLRRSSKMQLSASFFGATSQWTAPFVISNIGRIHLRVYQHGKGYGLLKIDVLMEGATLYVHIDEAGFNWPYSIRNFTDRPFRFYQANPYVDDAGIELPRNPQFTPVVYLIPPKSVMPYAWDYPAESLKELVIEANGRERRVQLAEIGNLPPMKVPGSRNQAPCIVDLNVVADGPTQTLVLSNYDPEVSLYKLKNNASQTSIASSTAPTEAFSVQEDEGDITLNVNVKFEGIGVSLINRRMQELCYMTLRGIEFNFKTSDLYDTFSIKMKWMQIDNQLFGGVYPIILFPSVVPQTGKEMEAHPTFSSSVTRVRDENHGVLYIKFFTVLLQQITLEMDEDFLFAAIDFYNSYMEGQRRHVDKLCDDDLHIPEPLNDTEGLDLYFEILNLQPAQMDLSFVRTEHVNAEEKTDSQTALGFFLNALTMAIGNINDAPVRLNALVMENVRTPFPLLMQSVSAHYRQEFMNQIHKILGSADFLGNPVGLFNNLSSGFMDMFYEPYQGYILNDRPQELGIGIAKGGISFMKKSIFGFSDSISKVTGSISKGLTAATMDRSFQDQRRMKMGRNRPKHALNGLTSAANSLVDGITSGVTGLALAPVRGATEEGAAGFFKGLGKGLIGLPTKTAIGIFDFANSLSEGVKNTTTIFDGNAIERIRPPRHFSHDGIIRPYNLRNSQGQEWLKMCNNSEFFNERYLAHLTLSESEMVVMVTFMRIMLLNTSTMTTEWEVMFRDLQTIAMERTGLALILRGGVQGPFIPIPDSSSRKYLYKEIGIAVMEYNRKYQAVS